MNESDSDQFGAGQESPGRVVTITVAGRSYRVVSSASEDELSRLVALVDEKVQSFSSKRASAIDALALTAIALAHELELERGKRKRIERAVLAVLKGIVTRLDQAVGATEFSQTETPMRGVSDPHQPK